MRQKNSLIFLTQLYNTITNKTSFALSHGTFLDMYYSKRNKNLYFVSSYNKTHDIKPCRGKSGKYHETSNESHVRIIPIVKLLVQNIKGLKRQNN